MKKLIVVAIIAMMITGLSVAANAYAGVTLNVAPVTNAGSFQTVQLGWMTQDAMVGGVPTTNAKDLSVDGANGLTAMAGQVEMDILNSVIASSKVNGDWRAPVVDVPTNTQVWRLKVTVPTYPVDEFDQTLYEATPFGIDAYFNPGMGLAGAKMYLLNGNFTTAALAKAATLTSALLWTAPLGDAGHFTTLANAFTIPVPVYDADNDVWITTAAFKSFTVYAEGAPSVPEPGSMLAMFSGLIGLVGFGIRRRK